ncbi:hypothetical protein SAMN05660845_0095 [Flavobacterium swingsii]|uniref:C1q domain-containing protein n=1 Tax=Flavobacterium swingsii TaxID=498292 RepID=A0A1I0V0M7_9FLAO|nr:hypothetical protein [Flavobacterium swingsii]SFA69889.1 hypothetical protein SAMN05660845_0095 [Flavobacterium swingsii]
MKNLQKTSKRLFLGIIILSLAITSSCSPEDGKDGKDGINGTNASIANTGFHVIPPETFDQSIPNITYTKVQFGVETTDDMNAFNTATSELTIPQNGFYHLSVTLKFFTALPDNSPVVVQLRKNGWQFKSFSQRLGAVPSININGDFSLNAGDVITVFIFQNTGAAQSLDRVANNTYFTGYRVY